MQDLTADAADCHARWRVLVVDDDPIARNMIVGAVANGGYRVAAEANGRRAIKWLEENHADLVVSDIFMPEGDGIEVIRYVRSSRPDTRVLVVSGGDSLLGQDYLVIARQLGADRAVGKPFRLRNLMAVVDELFTKFSGQDFDI